MKINSEQEMLDFGAAFAEKLKSENRLDAVIELIGDVGAGKTTFVRGLAQGLGVKRPVTSPSFTISKSYAFDDDKTLTHYDFYRLGDPGLMSEDLTDAIKNHHLVIVEWAETVEALLPKDHIKIFITLTDTASRNVEIADERDDAELSANVFSRGSEDDGEKLVMMCSKGHENLARAARSVPAGHAMTSFSPSSLITMFLDTSTPTTTLKINDTVYTHTFSNTLSKNLLAFIKEKLDENNKTWTDIEKITFMSGPGSFTGLRIGAAVVNALSHELNVPLYDHHGNLHKIILPDYGRPANITKPKK